MRRQLTVKGRRYMPPYWIVTDYFARVRASCGAYWLPFEMGAAPIGDADFGIGIFLRCSSEGDLLVRSSSGCISGMRPYFTTKRRNSFGVIWRASRNCRLKFDRLENPVSAATMLMGKSVSTRSMQARPIRNLRKYSLTFSPR